MNPDDASAPLNGNTSESFVPAIKCDQCKLSIKPGGHHLAIQHCLFATMERIELQKGMLSQAAGVISTLKTTGKLFWILINSSDDHKLTFTVQQLAAVPKGAGVKMDPTSTGIIVEAVIKK